MGNSIIAERINCPVTQQNIFEKDGFKEPVECITKKFFSQSDYQEDEIKSFIIGNLISDYKYFHFLLPKNLLQEDFIFYPYFPVLMDEHKISFEEDIKINYSFYLFKISFKNHATVCFIDKQNKIIIFYEPNLITTFFFVSDYRAIVFEIMKKIDSVNFSDYNIFILNGEQVGNCSMCAGFSFFVCLKIIDFFKKKGSVVFSISDYHSFIEKEIKPISRRSLCQNFYDSEIYKSSLFKQENKQFILDLINLYNLILFVNEGKIVFDRDKKKDYFLKDEDLFINTEYMNNIFFLIDNFYRMGILTDFFYEFLFLIKMEFIIGLTCNKDDIEISEEITGIESDEKLITQKKFFTFLKRQGIVTVKLTDTLETIFEKPQLKGENIAKWKKLETEAFVICECDGRFPEGCPLIQLNDDGKTALPTKCPVEMKIPQMQESTVDAIFRSRYEMLPDYIKEKIF